MWNAWHDFEPAGKKARRREIFKEILYCILAVALIIVFEFCMYKTTGKIIVLF